MVLNILKKLKMKLIIMSIHMLYVMTNFNKLMFRAYIYFVENYSDLNMLF